MKYTYENQEKALEYLVENAPHDIEKIKKLYNVEAQDGRKPVISLREILFSEVWSVKEKIELIKLYGHDKSREWTYKTDERDLGYMVNIEGLPLIDQCIKEGNLSGVKVLLDLGANISVATIIRIIEYIKSPSERYKFCKLIVNHYKDKEVINAYVGTGNQCYLKQIPSLCDRYAEYTDSYEPHFWTTVSSMENICSTNDLKLVKLFLPTVKNIKPLFHFAVETGNIEMVKLFIEAGADVNFQDLEFKYDNGRRIFKTPIKIAIDNNDLEMIKFLHQNGADLNFVDKSERMQEFINNLKRDESQEGINKYKEECDKHDYITWANTPLEYAIKLGAASIINQDLINSISPRTKQDIEDQFQDRANIVRYLYDNGAKFSNNQINYTDLICFAIKSDDFASTKYYFEEAFKNNTKLDFVKIISFIHTPGRVKTSRHSTTYYYKDFEYGASDFFRLCEEYSKKMDDKNYNRDVKLMLEKIFDDFSLQEFDKYKDVITDFSKILPKDMLKDIPAVFGVKFKNLKDVLDLGYDINSTKEGKSIIMDYVIHRYLDPHTLNELISLGADINYQSPNGGSALSCAIAQFPLYDFGTFIRNFNRETKQLYKPIEEYEREIKSLVKAIINLSSKEIIISDNVKAMVYWKIAPGYPQIIYNEILEELSKKGFTVDDEYFTKSICFLGESYSYKYITNQWGYLWNLYNNFSNRSIELNYEFPKIEDVKNIEYGTKQSSNVFALISEHLKRNFATSIKEIPEPNKIVDINYYGHYITKKLEDRTALQEAQDKLLGEISRYIGNLDYRQIMSLIDSFSLIDIESINRNELLIVAIEMEDKNLCKELIKRGATIVCYDIDGHDVTSKIYSEDQISTFLSLCEDYNPDKECEDLLAEIGCEKKAFKKTKRKKSKEKNN